MANTEDIKSKLERMRQKAREMEAQLALLENAEREKQKIRDAKDDLRRRSVIGSIIHAEWRAGNMTTDQLRDLIGRHIKKESDLALFGLV